MEQPYALRRRAAGDTRWWPDPYFDPYRVHALDIARLTREMRDEEDAVHAAMEAADAAERGEKPAGG